MTKKEKFALFRAGIIIGKVKYKNVTQTYLLPQLLLKFDWLKWPSMKTFDEIFHNTASNSTILTFNGTSVGLTLMDNSIHGDELSVLLSHPMSNYWLSFLQPIWDEQNKDKCKTCHGSGWDGIGYILTCVECGGTGKI